jgi:phosphosulfolactate phosphohydrolase-like enzyme
LKLAYIERRTACGKSLSANSSRAILTDVERQTKAVADNMKSKTTKVIMVETWRKTIIRQPAPPIFARCEQCGIETEMFSPEEFARRQKTTARLVYRRIESGDCHFVETEDGALLVCGWSMPEKSK